MEKSTGKVIPIKKNKREFFRAYVEILRPFLKQIRKREADLFAELLYQNYDKSEIKNKTDRFKLILEHDNRKKIEQYLNMSTAVFRNSLTVLRKKGLINDSNLIPDAYLLYPKENNFELKFNFIIEK